MLDAIRRAKALYYDKENWQGLVKHAMGCDNSWKRSAASYVAMYNEVAGVAESAKGE